jgi:hypothetical protein
MGHIFISYDHEDIDFAENVKHEIENAGFTAYMDKDGLHAGDNWRREIDQAIRESSALIVIMTPNAKNSEYVNYEWAFAFGAGRKVIPLLRKSTEKHPRLEDIQYRDFTGSGTRPWDKLIEDLQNIESFHPQTESVPGTTEFPTTDEINSNRNYQIRRALQISNKYFDDATVPQKIVIKFTNRDESNSIQIKKIKYSDSGLGLPAAALLSSYTREDSGYFIIAKYNDYILQPGESFNVDLVLGPIWKKEDINRWAGHWGYLRIDTIYKQEEIELFTSI